MYYFLLAKRIVFVAIFILIFIFIISIYFVKLYFVRGSSMEPTLFNGDLVFVIKSTYLSLNYQLNDIVLVKKDNSEIVKRIVALPYDEVFVDENKVIINNSKIIYFKLLPSIPKPPVKKYHLGTVEYFILGDNLSVSIDSRFLGPVKISEITGKVIFRIWPLFRK